MSRKKKMFLDSLTTTKFAPQANNEIGKGKKTANV